MSETGDPIDGMDLDMPSRQAGPVENQTGNNLIALDGSLPSIRSVSLVLQGLLPLIISLILFVAGRRLYRFTTTVSVALSSALFTWALFVNLENGQSIGNWTGEVAAVTVWSVMIGGSLIGALIGYQFTWWGAHVTGRLCLGANSGVGFAFSVLLLKHGLLIHSPGGQWSLVAGFAVMGILIVLWDHVIGPLVAITLCGSFLFLLGSDMFNSLGLNGVAAGLRLLLDHNPDHSMYITSYNPSRSTVILIIVSWAIGFISFAFQYACYSVPFGPLLPAEDADEEQGLDSESKTKESLTEPNKELSESDLELIVTDPSQAIGTNPNRGSESNETSVGTKTDANLNDTNRTIDQNAQETSSLPYLSSRHSGECGSPAALALSPSVYSRYRRTQDPVHKPPSRSPVQYKFHSNLISFTNPRRVDTVEEVTESSTSVRGGELTACSSIHTVGGASEAIGRSNSMSEEYIKAMMHLASEECRTDKSETVGVESIDSRNQDNHMQRAKEATNAPIAQVPISASPNAPDPYDHEKIQAEGSAQQSEGKVSIISSISLPVPSNMGSIPTKTETSLPSNPVAIETPSTAHTNQPSGVERNSKTESARPTNPLLNGPQSTNGQEPLRGNHADKITSNNHEQDETSTKAESNGVLSRVQARSDELSTAARSSPSLLNRNSQEIAAVSHPGVRNVKSEAHSEPSTLNEDITARSTRSSLKVPPEGDVSDSKRFSNRPLPRTPSQRPTSFDRSTIADKQERAPKMGKVMDNNRSLKSANSTGSSTLDSFLRVGNDSSVPTSPSSTGKTLNEGQEGVETVATPTRKRLSIMTGKQAQIPRKTSTRTQTSQEAQIDNLPDLSPTTSNHSAVPHTPTLGNMLLRVSEGAGKSRGQSDHVDQRAQDTSHGVFSNGFSRGEDLDDVDAITLRSEPSRRSTICFSSVYADHTSAEEGGQSCSESEDDQSYEQYFDPRRIKQLDRAVGEWGNLFSDELTTVEGETEGSSSHSNRRKDERSPSLHSIPLPTRQIKPKNSSSTFAASSSMNTTPIGSTLFVGQPLAEVPWPQMRPDKRSETGTSTGIESQQKRWTTASSIFPPLGYESSMESSPPPHLLSNEEDETESYASDLGPNRIRMLRSSRLSTGTQTSFEGDANNKKQPSMFCSASSHVADEYDTSDITSRIDDSTDEEDPNYESAADYSKSFRPSGSFGAADGGYLSADDGNSQVDF